MVAYRTGWPPHLVAGVTEADYVECGLADDVAAEIERILLDEDRRTGPTKRSTFRRRGARDGP